MPHIAWKLLVDKGGLVDHPRMLFAGHQVRNISARVGLEISQVKY